MHHRSLFTITTTQDHWTLNSSQDGDVLATLSKLLQAAASKLSIEALRPGRANTFGPDLLLLHPLKLYGESLYLHLHPSPRKAFGCRAQVHGLVRSALHVTGVRLVCRVYLRI